MFRHGCLGQTSSLYTNWTELEFRSRSFSLEISPNSVQFSQFSSCDANTLKFLIDWLIDLLIDWLTDWLTDWLIDWLIDYWIYLTGSWQVCSPTHWRCWWSRWTRPHSRSSQSGTAEWWWTGAELPRCWWGWRWPCFCVEVASLNRSWCSGPLSAFLHPRWSDVTAHQHIIGYWPHIHNIEYFMLSLNKAGISTPWGWKKERVFFCVHLF